MSVPGDTNVIYVLRVDVVNPKPDRRSRDFDNQPIWFKGTHFTIDRGNTITYRPREGDHATCRTNYGCHLFEGRAGHTALIFAADTRAPRTVAEVLEVNGESHVHCASTETLQRLVDHGALTLNRVAEAVKAVVND